MMVATYVRSNYKKDKIDWEKENPLDQLIEKHKGKILTIVLFHFQGERIVLLHYII